MKFKKIALLRKDTGSYGGIESQIFKIAQGIMQHNFLVYFITDNENSELVKKLTSIGVNIKVVSFKNIFWTGIKIGRICKYEGISIIQSHMLKDSFIAKISKLYAKNLIHVFRVHTYIDCSHISKRKKDLYHIISKLTDCLVDYYLSINEFNIKELHSRTHINKHKMRVIHDIIPFIGEIDKTSEKQEKHIGMIANFYPFKGHDILVKGIKILKDQGICVHASILGGESYPIGENQTPVVTNKIKELCTTLEIDDQIEFCGFVDDIYNKIKDIDVIVLPSYMEGTPNCLLEAMSLKKIVLASNVGGIPEFIQDGVNGFLHNPRSPKSFAEALIKIFNLNDNRRNEIHQNAYHTWLREFHEDEVIKELLDFYRMI